MENIGKTEEFKAIKKVLNYFKSKDEEINNDKNLSLEEIKELKNLLNFDTNIEIHLNKILYLLIHCNSNLKYEDKIIGYDILVFKYIILKLLQKDENIFTIFGIINNNTEPNYNILPKIYSSPEIGKIKVELILDVIFGKGLNIPFQTIKVSEYLIQRKITSSKLILLLIKVRLLLWFQTYEPKSPEWCIWFFNSEIENKSEWKKLEELMEF